MKATIRIPTVQFGYIEFEFEQRDLIDKEKTPADVLIEAHNEMLKRYETTKGEIQKLKDDNF